MLYRRVVLDEIARGCMALRALRCRRVGLIAISGYLLVGCASIQGQRLNPGGQPFIQNITYAPISQQSNPLRIQRSTSIAASISAVLPARTVSSATSGGECVTESTPGGLSPGSNQYTLSFTAIDKAPANCTQTFAVTMDGNVVPFYLVVP